MNYLCILRISCTWLWSIILLLCHCILIANILSRIYASILICETHLSFHFCIAFVFNLSFPGENYLKLVLFCICLCLHTESNSTLCNPMDGSPPPGSSVHGIFQATILEQVPFPSPGYLPNPVIETSSLVFLALAGRFFTN